MKKFVFVLLIALLMGGCMKDYSDDVVPDVSEEFFQLKVAGATLAGDTAYAVPRIYIKFWLDALPEAAKNYSYSWNLGDGTTSVAFSPEHLYQLGTYKVQVDITNNTGQTVERSLVLVVTNDFSYETTIILLESTPVAGGNYDYKLALKSSVIYNYGNTTGSRWVVGDFTSWNQVTVTEVRMINQIEYLVYHLVLPANETKKQRFSYGRGSNWAFAPNSRFWAGNDKGEGAFEAYFTNGQISSSSYIPSNQLPGDNGDVNQGNILATIRTEIVGSNDEILRIYVNYGVYANGSNPFFSQLLSNSNWNPVSLISIGGGWGYRDFPVVNLENGRLFWRFGPNIAQVANLGDMTNSKFYLPTDNMLGVQITQLKSSKWRIEPLQ